MDLSNIINQFNEQKNEKQKALVQRERLKEAFQKNLWNLLKQTAVIAIDDAIRQLRSNGIKAEKQFRENSGAGPWVILKVNGSELKFDESAGGVRVKGGKTGGLYVTQDLEGQTVLNKEIAEFHVKEFVEQALLDSGDESHV